MADDRSPSRPHRPVRSYVLRQGRMSAGRQHALDELLPRFGIPFAQHAIDFATVFGRTAPVVLEIGFGMGEATSIIAEAHPAVDFIGIEVHGPGVGSLLKRIAELELRNLRVIRHDAVEVVRSMIPHDSLAGIHVYFPDPWPKKRHHKRRLVRPPFVHDLALRLAPGGYLHVATDWADYAAEMVSTLSAEPLLVNTAERFAPRPPWRPPTKFERRGVALGHAVYDLLFRKAADATATGRAMPSGAPAASPFSV